MGHQHEVTTSLRPKAEGASRSRERLVRSSQLRLFMADPEVSGAELYADMATGATLLGSAGSRVRCADLDALPVARAGIAVRRVVTAEGLVAATNRLLGGLGLPYRLVPLTRTPGVVSCVSVRTAGLDVIPAALDFEEPQLDVDDRLEEDDLRAFDGLRDVA